MPSGDKSKLVQENEAPAQMLCVMAFTSFTVLVFYRLGNKVNI